MAVRLNQPAFEHAKRLLQEGKAVFDIRDDWSEHRPSPGTENEFIRARGVDEYSKWHLGINDKADARSKARYAFPYGDFENVHRCALLAAESRAGQYRHHDIETAATLLEQMVDQLREVSKG